MNPLLSFWIKVQPLSSSFGSHTWKAVSQSSSLAPSSGDDAIVSRSSTTYSWAFDYFKSNTSRLASNLYWDVFYLVTSSSWPLKPVISRMQDAPILKPSPKAQCEGYKRYITRKVDTTKVDPKRLTSSSNRSPLQQSQLILQHQDYLNYQIAVAPIKRRNSKEWVPQYKKERIDKINYNNVFGGICNADQNEIPTLPPISSSEGRSDIESPKYSIQPISPTSSTTSTATPETVESMPLTSHPSPTISSNLKNDGPSPADVICGRGGKANTHTGNISFREEAKKLRSWYESSSKSEKFTISSFLVDVVRERGGRFLKRDPERSGGWLELESDEVRKKASQALREGRMKEKRR